MTDSHTFETWYSMQVNKATTEQDRKLIHAAWRAGVRAGYKESIEGARDAADTLGTTA